MVEMMDVISAEENLRQAQLLNLFTAKADTKKASAEIRRKQSAYIRRQKKIRMDGLSDAVNKKPIIEVINPASLDERERERLRQWAQEQGLETNQQ